MKTLLIRSWRALAILSAALIVVLILALSWGFSQRDAAKAASRAEEGLKQRSYEGFVSALAAMGDQFGKLKAASTPEQFQPLLAEAFRRSGEAAILLEHLPLDAETSAGLTRFVNQAGDYAAYLLRRVARSEMPDDDALKQFEALENACSELLEKLNPAVMSSAIGGYGFPTLLYDGPFSDSALKSAPRGLPDELVSMSEAGEVAQKLTGSDSFFSGTPVTNAPIPYYLFSGYRYGAQTDVAITLRGGKPLWWTEDSASGESAAPIEAQRLTAFDKARETLLANGFEGMEATYWQQSGGALTISFAATQDGVLLYPDLVKVWVDFEKSRVVGLDARNYHMNHVERSLPADYRSAEQAQATISSHVTVGRGARLCVIPLPYGEETLCYEFRATLGDEEYLIYIDALSGQERDILRLVKSSYGTSVR